MSFPAQVIRFGPFQLDLRAAELQHNGTKIKLPEQPFQILAELVEHPGEVVTREELRQRLWRSDTFVDFEHGLNTAVKRLREALGDSAEKPRYIETLPRHGYRLMVPVEKAEPAASVTSKASVRRRSLRLAVSVLIIAAVAGGVVWQSRLRERLRPVKIESLAVLPLENLSGNPEEEYFADGMTEALLIELSKIGLLKVISRTSVMQYKGAKKSVREIARELGVAGVVEGSVLRSGNRVRITAQLIDAREDRYLWADSYDRDLRDVLALHSEVARTIADRVRVVITPEERQRLTEARRVNPEAYQAYLKGRHYWSLRSLENLRKGMDQFQQAIALDPGYAPAYAGLADSYIILSSFARMPGDEGARQARAAAQQALALDQNLAEAHTSLADILAFSEWDWVGAEKEFRRALELNPSYATGHQWYAEMLMAVGRSQESLAEVRKARELDPLSPAVNAIVGWMLYVDRQYDAAIQQEQKVLEMYPDFPLGHFMLGQACWGGGRTTEAIVAFQKAYQLEEDAPLYLAYLAHAYAQSGRRADAFRLRQELRRREKVGYVSPQVLATFALGFQEKERALTFLEKLYEKRGGFADEQLRKPLYDPIRADPRFQDLLRRMNIPQ
jgi:TolB-like protein/DNA-binding winged helix-turn-helix (wHTH) protein/tetratricopeptide (TPR) repeat protein